MSTFAESYANYYDLLYADKDYVSEADYVVTLMRRGQPNASRVLELGCGTGRHAELLAQRGFSVHGIDRSEQMVQQALKRVSSSKTSGGPLSFAVGDVTNYQTDARFEAVISLFHVVSYQTSNQDVRSMFKVASEHLVPGGVFVFDVWYGPAVLEQKPTIRIKRLIDSKRSITRIAEPRIRPNENLVEVHYSIHCDDRQSAHHEEITEIHTVRYFFLPELELMLGLADFKLAVAEEWMTGSAPSSSTWGVTIVARKQMPGAAKV